MVLESGERIEDLQCNGLKIIQNKNYYTFTSDSVVLANFISLNKNDVCVEIGTGCGIISILLSAKTSFNKIYGFEIQQQMALLANKNVELNDLSSKIEIIFDDICNFDKYLTRGSVDCVFSNPPFMKNDVPNENLIKSIARHEIKLPLKKLVSAASQMLKFNGTFYLVYDSSRVCELISTLLEFNLQPKTMFFTQNGRGDVKLVVIKAVKGGKTGVKVLPELVTNEANGNYLENLHTKYLGK